jgi:peptidoglycan hydrolase-like protein with peptidoglycan-binding domain
MKKYCISALLLGVVFSLSTAFAQVSGTLLISSPVVDTVADQIDCTALRYALSLGSKDSKTGGDVTNLQVYLSQTGYLDVDPTGYFGNATKKAVQAFQRANGIAPQGNVGPYTRAKIKELSCNGPVAQQPVPTTPTNPVMCTMEARLCNDGSIMPRDANCGWHPEQCSTTRCTQEMVQCPDGSYSGRSGPNCETNCSQKTQGNSFRVLAPTGGNYNVTDSIPISWTPYTGGGIPYLYNISLCNKMINFCESTTRMSFDINTRSYSVTPKDIAELKPSFLLALQRSNNNPNNLTFEQIKNSYFLHVVVYAKTATTDVGFADSNLFTISDNTQTTTSPTVEFLSAPTLKLQYDSVGKESVLVGNATIKVTTGSDAVGSTCSPLLQLMDTITGARYWTNSSSITPLSFSVPSNSSQNIGMVISVPTKQLFAGTYVVVPSDFCYSKDGINYTGLSVGVSSFVNAKQSQPVTIIGETSPYISSVTSDANGNVTISGVRLNVSDQIQIDGLPIRVNVGGNTGSTMQFAVPAFIVDGAHSIRVIDVSTGASNTSTLNLINTTRISPFIQVTILPNGTIGSAYSTTLTSVTTSQSGVIGVSNPSDVKVWSLESGTLPSGLTLSPSGVISGTVNSNAVTSTFTVAVRVNGITTSRSMTIVINTIATAVGASESLPTSVYPTSGVAGAVITVTGTNIPTVGNVIHLFKTDASGNLINGSDILLETVPGGSATSRSFIVPSGYVAGQYKVRVADGYLKISYAYPIFTINSVTVPFTTSPTASLTINGSHDVTLTAGQAHQKVWASTGGTSWNSTYSFAQDNTLGAMKCSHLDSGSWNGSGGNTSSGFVNDVANQNNVGCTATIIYTVTNAQGVSVSDTLRVTTVAPPTASLTVPGQPDPHNVTLPSQTPHRKVWSSTGGVSWKSRYIFENAPGKTCSKAGETGDWSASTTSGYVDNIASDVNIGCRATIEFIVTNGVGVSAKDTLYVTTTPRVVLTPLVPASSGGGTVSKMVLGAFASNVSCTDIPRNLIRGSESSYVTTLQDFLSSKGFLKESSTGFYGDKTVEAVKDYQASKGLPVTGMVYDFTRQAIVTDTCQ